MEGYGLVEVSSGVGGCWMTDWEPGLAGHEGSWVGVPLAVWTWWLSLLKYLSIYSNSTGQAIKSPHPLGHLVPSLLPLLFQQSSLGGLAGCWAYCLGIGDFFLARALLKRGDLGAGISGGGLLNQGVISSSF